ncbi:GGDEF domain-containing protein [Cetobacterium sp.]|uniref:GGDEF domain-containing protein n=1 Tax=Cetobacterium sp. TaxID=2071632 RepID=UPI003F2DBE7E
MIGDNTLNSLIIEIFEKSLKLDVTIVKGKRREVYKKLENGAIDALGLVYLNNKREGSDNIRLSNPIYDENLYVASDEKILENINSLENQNIYVYKGDKFQINKLQNYLKENKILAKIIEVENLDDYRSEIYMNSEIITSRSQNRLLISYLAPVYIGVNKKFEHLLPQINKALDTEHRVKITEYISSLPLYYQRERFLKNLDENEKKWIANQKKLIISLEDKTPLNRYSENTEKYMGLISEYLNRISKILNIEIEYRNHEDNNRINSVKDLKNKNIDLLISSEYLILDKNFIYSKELDKMPIYILTHIGSMSPKIGIVKNDFAMKLAEEYHSRHNIIEYETVEKLFKAFENDQVGSIISPYLNFGETCRKVHKTIKLQDIPINFLISKDNLILKSIVDKAISVMNVVDKSEIEKLVENNQEADFILEKEKNKKKQLYFSGLILIVILLLVKLQKKQKLLDVLKYDQLTKLPNRFLFNKMCKKRKLCKGFAVVIDLDNFKFANDNYGHNVGDLVLVEVANILLKVFKQESCFRISGDEFYIFYEEEKIIPQIEEIFKLGKESIILKKYKISFSVGCYEKHVTENIILAFNKADFKMYEAKKIKGFSYSL